MAEVRWPRRPDEVIAPDAAATLAGVPVEDLYAALVDGSLVAADGQLRRRDAAAWGERLRMTRLPSDADRAVHQFTREGFVTLGGAIAEADAQALRSICSVVAGAPPGVTDDRWQHTGAGVLERIVRLQELVPKVLEPILAADTVIRVTDAVYPSVYGIYGIALVMSEPGVGPGMAVHRDPTWTTRVTGDVVCAAGLQLDEAGSANGGVGFLRATHRDATASCASGERCVPETQAGDVVLHNLGVLHGSRPNRSKQPRWVVYYSFMSAREAVTGGRALIVARSAEQGWLA